MASDYGLSSMTGVLAPIVVAGAATKMVQGMSGQRPQPTRRKKKKARRANAWGGNFGNIGL